MDNKFLSTLGLARRAGKIAYGYDAVVGALGNCKLVLLASDLSARSRNSVLQQAARAGVECKDIAYTMAQIAVGIGTKPVGIVGVTEKGFARLLAGALEKENVGGTQL